MNGDLVASYTYDAWGNHTVYDPWGDVSTYYGTIGNINPIRYRSYYYDTETGLYYLQTRYYDPEIGRFISPDSTKYLDPESINGLNLYAYCLNNPVMYEDETGRSATLALLTVALVSGLVSAGANAFGQVIFDETFELEKVVIAGIAGFIAGLIPGSGFATIVSQAFVSSLVENGLSAIWLGDEFDFGMVVKNTIVSIGTGYAIKGVTHWTSKLTSKIFHKAPNYSQYQHYYRSKGYDYSRQEIYDIIKKHQKSKSVTDDVIEHASDFLFSLLTYPL